MLRGGQFTISTGQMRKVPLRESVPAVARAGYAGIVLGMDVYLLAREAGMSDADIRALVADNGLEIEYFDGLVCWMPGAPAPTPPPGVRMVTEPQAFFDAAAAVGAPMINAVEVFGYNPGQAAAIDGFGAICDGAAASGLRICLEFTPLGAVPAIGDAWAIVDKAGRANGGVLCDCWHFARSGGTDADIRAVPAERIFGVQLCDVQEKPHEQPFVEAMRFRMLPGHGFGDVPGTLKSLWSHGVRRPWSAEVYSEELLERPLDEMLAATLTAMHEVAPAEART